MVLFSVFLCRTYTLCFLSGVLTRVWTETPRLISSTYTMTIGWDNNKTRYFTEVSRLPSISSIHQDACCCYIGTCKQTGTALLLYYAHRPTHDSIFNRTADPTSIFSVVECWAKSCTIQIPLGSYVRKSCVITIIHIIISNRSYRSYVSHRSQRS